jgi:hypothetical protein
MGSATLFVFRLISAIAALVFGAVTVVVSLPAQAADPYITPPEECETWTPALPDQFNSAIFWSDDCDLIYVGPPSKIVANAAASFNSVPKADCDVIAEVTDALNDLKRERVTLGKAVIQKQVSSTEFLERKALLSSVDELLSEAVADDYKVFGATATVTITQLWLDNVKKLAELNPPPRKVLPLPTVAGLLTFQELVTPEELEVFGLYDNSTKLPVMSYTVTGMTPIGADSPLVDGDKLPIFFPRARADRASLKTVEFGGGAVTGVLTFNKAGYCQLTGAEGQSPVAFLAPTLTFSMALKTAGSYKVHIEHDYALTVAESLAKETNGTYYASALANKFFEDRSTSTISVEIDQDLMNSITSEQADGLVQTVLYDAANQFLTTIAGEFAERRRVELPEIENVERYTTIQKIRQVCRRSSGFLGIGGSSRCWDEAYNVQVLQNTSSYQEAVSRLEATFTGDAITRTATYILVPWNAGL